MEVSENTEAILSDDYEEGEILDEDTLYDNVSSLEEFSGSDSELKSHGEVNTIIVKKATSYDHKEKHHRRKEHKCKEDSICRKERSGKHCYARIRRGKTILDVAEKGKSTDSVINHCHDLQTSKKKSHVILSPVHDSISKYNSRRLSVQKDLHEKENRITHKHSRYYDNHKSVQHRIDKKKSTDKAKKRSVVGNSRSHESRKRSRSPSPKLPARIQINELTISKGKSSLLKRLVGSGSIGVKTPKDVEEPKKVEIPSTGVCVNEEPPKDVEAIETISLISEDLEQKSDNTFKAQDDDELLKVVEVNETDSTQKTLDKVESIDDVIFVCEQRGLKPNSNQEIIDSKEHNQDLDNLTNDNALAISEKSIHSQSESEEVIAEISDEVSEVLDHIVQDVVNDSENDTYANTNLGNSSQNDKHEQKLTDDIDELNLRLEALRTAMLRKHRERKKRGFICRKKSSLEDDSFAEYVLSHIDKDNSLIINDEVRKEISHSDSNGVNLLGDLLNPEDMVIDKNDRDVENNILENFPYPPSYSVQNSDGPIPYVGFSVYQYPVINGNEQDLVPIPDGSISRDFPSYPLPNTQIVVSPLIPDTSQIPLPEESVSFSRTEFGETLANHSNDNDCIENCLKEINSNKEPFIERNKRVRRLSSRYKLCRRRKVNGKKWHTSREVVKRKLERREYAEQKRRRKESLRDLKIIRTDGVTSHELNTEESDEEFALRELALKSVKEREKSKTLLESVSNQDTDKISISASTTNMNEGQMLGDLQIDVDTNSNSKPLTSFDSGTPTNLSSEPWDDIDEDILRAQLLSSLSSRIPDKHAENSTTFGPKYSKKQVKALLRAERKCFDSRSDKKLKLTSLKVNKENFKRVAKNKANDIAKRKMQEMLQNMNYFKRSHKKNSQLIGQTSAEVPIVPKFIISLEEDSTSEEDTINPLVSEQHDVVKSIDLFLQEARIENDMKQGLLGKDEKEGSSSKLEEPVVEGTKENKKTITGGSTPQVLKHLPAWQQEEYRRLKKQIAEKEKVLKAAKEKVLLPLETEGALKEVILPKEQKSQNEEENDTCSKIVEETVNTCSENDNESVKIIVNDVFSTSNNERLVTTLKTKVVTQQTNTKQTPALSNDSSKIIDEVNHLANIVAQLERGMGDYRSLKEDIVRKKREILIAKLNMAKQKKMLFEIKRKITTKEKIIQAKLEQDILLPDAKTTESIDKKKLVGPASRDLELCKLRMREFSLRTKMIFDEIDHSSGLNKTMKISSKGGIISMDKSNISMEKTALQAVPNCRRLDKTPNRITRQPKLLPSVDKVNRNNNTLQGPIKSKSMSLSVSDKQTENWDPFVPICPFDLSGVCKDEECKFQHIKAA
ncbi:uncharacterized protein isoform X3 [Rhodnius prolixus]|uniref:uncharacterized protein isoform X3 n=1 Tax=Rhodnius prolixus TaxID=13249 RepID=UPI003D188BCE